MLFQNFRVPEELDRVSRVMGGIYHFSLRFPSNYELGYSDSKGVNIERVSEVLLRTIKKFDAVYSSESINGELSTPHKSSHLKTIYDIQASMSPKNHAYRLMKDYLSMPLSDKRLKDLINSLRLAYEMAPPLYVGMTYKQSLSGRLMQHYSGSSGFSDELKKYNLGWNNVIYKCIELEAENKSSIESIEDIIQSLFKPVFSKK